MYADYDFYKENWSGKIPTDEYNLIAVQASQQIDYLTFDRLTNGAEITERVKLCQCELADFLYQREIEMGLNDKKAAPIKSETVDSYRVEHAVTTTTKAKSQGDIDSGVVGVCRKWLTRPTNLMYVGVDCLC